MLLTPEHASFISFFVHACKTRIACNMLWGLLALIIINNGKVYPIKNTRQR